jgi:hypothetical protein
LTIAYFSGKVSEDHTEGLGTVRTWPSPALNLKANKEVDQPDSEPAAEDRHGSELSLEKQLLESCKETNSLLRVLIKKTTNVEGNEWSRLSVRH